MPGDPEAMTRGIERGEAAIQSYNEQVAGADGMDDQRLLDELLTDLALWARDKDVDFTLAFTRAARFERTMRGGR